MPIHKPNMDPPFNIVRASHVELGLRDLGRARAFYVDCLGLLPTAEDADALYLRGVEERNHHSIVLRKAGVHRASMTLANLSRKRGKCRDGSEFVVAGLVPATPIIGHRVILIEIAGTSPAMTS